VELFLLGLRKAQHKWPPVFIFAGILAQFQLPDSIKNLEIDLSFHQSVGDGCLNSVPDILMEST
jgi:hypothetical protein